MLWYKGWLETRFRLVFILAFMGFILAVQHSTHASHAGFPGKQVLTAFVTMTFINTVVVGAVFGAAGIATQPSFAVQRGIHGSTLYTVSLPVSRLRLLLVRATLGWLEGVAAMALLCGGLWFGVSWLHAAMTGLEMAGYFAALLACGSVFYCVAVLLGSFLEDQWRVWGTMLVAGTFVFASVRLHLPAFVDMLRAMTQLLTEHVVRWSTMAFSLALAVGLLLATARIVHVREY